jgi:hypothetical protein
MEMAFITTMFLGLLLNAVGCLLESRSPLVQMCANRDIQTLAKAWKMSMGSFNETIFRYTVGGEI